MLGQYTASLSCVCIFSIPWWALCRSARVPVEEFWGNADVASFEEEASLFRQLIQGAPEVLEYLWDLLPSIQLSTKGEAVQCVVHWVTFKGTLSGIQLSCGQLDMLEVLGYGYGEGFFAGGEVT